MPRDPGDRVLDRAELIAGVHGQDALLCLLTDAIDAEVLDATPEAGIQRGEYGALEDLGLEPHR